MLTCSKSSAFFFSGRARFLLFFFLAWGAVLSMRLLEIAVIRKDEYIRQCESVARRQGKIPQLRGRILDRNGIPLAWTLKTFTLHVEKKMLSSKTKDFPEKITDFLVSKSLASRDRIHEDEKVFSIAGLSPEALEELKNFSHIPQSASIRPSFERKTVDYKKVKEIIGETAEINAEMKGVSGAEEEWDSELSGRPGIYSVMLDRNRRIIEGTFIVVSEMVPGSDVNLDVSLSEILEEVEDND